MSGDNIIKRGFSTPIGHITQRISARLCGKYKHLKQGRLFMEWRLIFPDEVGILYHPMRLAGDKLWVQTSSTQAALLAYFAPNMVERINQYLGSDVVSSIQAHQGMKATAHNKVFKQKLHPLSDEYLNYTKDVADSDLKNALEQWGQFLEAAEKG